MDIVGGRYELLLCVRYDDDGADDALGPRGTVASYKPYKTFFSDCYMALRPQISTNYSAHKTHSPELFFQTPHIAISQLTRVLLTFTGFL